MQLIYETLYPHLNKRFAIEEDGTSQTRKTNTGRMGFYVEGLFGIKPNNSQKPDMGHFEIKSLQNNCTTCSVGTISKTNWDSILRGEQDRWEDSFVYAKMKSTLYVFYTKYEYPQLEYSIDSYGLVGLKDDSSMLQDEWSNIVSRIKAVGTYSNEPSAFTGKFTNMGNKLLNLTVKGDACHVYPSISFKSPVLKVMREKSLEYTEQHHARWLAEQDGDEVAKRSETVESTFSA